jgi:hypothetical protein
MRSDHADLLKRLRQRAPDAFRCATKQMLDDAELELGFPLPRLLRAIYRFVGNGGFGPGHGLIGVGGTEPYLSTHDSVVDLYEMRVRDNRLSEDVWPQRMLPICDYGCASYACVDCSRRSARVMRFDADVYLLMEKPNQRKSFRLESPSLAEWLTEWLDKPPA